MIRFLQRDNRITKAFFVVVIAAASVGMVVYLIPGLTGQGASQAGAGQTSGPGDGLHLARAGGAGSGQ